MTFFKVERPPLDVLEKEEIINKSLALLREKYTNIRHTPQYIELFSGWILWNLVTPVPGSTTGWPRSIGWPSCDLGISHLVVVNPYAETANEDSIQELYEFKHPFYKNGDFSGLVLEYVGSNGQIIYRKNCPAGASEARLPGDGEKVNLMDPHASTPIVKRSALAEAEGLHKKESELRQAVTAKRAEMAFLQAELDALYGQLDEVITEESVYRSSSFKPSM